ETGTIGLILYFLLFINLTVKSFHYFFMNRNGGKSCAVLFVYLSLAGTLIENLFGVNLRITSTAVVFWFSSGLLLWMLNEKNIGVLSEKRQIKSGAWKNPAIITGLAISVIILIVQIKSYYNSFRSEMIMQTATSYERPDSKFIDASGKESPQARHNYLIEFFSQAIAYNPRNLEAYYKLGHSYYNLNRFDESLETYKKLVRYAPFYANVNYNIALCYYGKGNLPAALYFLKRELYSNSTIDNFKQAYHFAKQLKPDFDNTAVLRSGLWVENDNVIFRSLLAYEYLNYARYYDSIEQYKIIANLYANNENDKYGRFLRDGVLSKIQKTESLKNIGVIYYNFLKKTEYAKIYFREYVDKTDNFEEKQRVQNIINRL
ncbi:MAG TPA: tetratricopeptide repeat protein, partial [bacterium]|nr:tetratricopeptide repeat protein [bacterium]